MYHVPVLLVSARLCGSLFGLSGLWFNISTEVCSSFSALIERQIWRHQKQLNSNELFLVSPSFLILLIFQSFIFMFLKSSDHWEKLVLRVKAVVVFRDIEIISTTGTTTVP